MSTLAQLKARRDERRKPRAIVVDAWDTTVLVQRLDDLQRLELSDLGEQYPTDDEGRILNKRDVKDFAATLLQRCLTDEQGGLIFDAGRHFRDDLHVGDERDTEGFEFLNDEDFSVLTPLLTAALDVNGIGAHSEDAEESKKKLADSTGE